MHPVQPRGGNLAAGESVVIKLDPNEIRCGIFGFDPYVFAPAVADGAEFTNQFVILAVKKSDDGSFGRADKNHAGSVFYFLTSHELQLKRLGRASLFGFDLSETKWLAQHLAGADGWSIWIPPPVGPVDGYPFFALWKLLDPQTFSTIDAFQAMPRESRERFFIRRTKEEMVTFEGKPLYPRRTTDTFSYDLKGSVMPEARCKQLRGRGRWRCLLRRASVCDRVDGGER